MRLKGEIKMKILVKFIAVDNKKEITDNATYIFNIYKALNSIGLIKSLSMTPDEVAFGAGPIRNLDDESNVFLLQFNSEENGKSDIWSIYFQYGTYNASKQLEITIYSDTYVPDVTDGYLEKLKLRIKKSIRKDWDKVIWLVDKDSECLSIALYPQIYKTENFMRELLNEVMTKQYGTSWWDSFAPTNIKNKHSDRLKEFKAKIQSFNDVDERLMCIDISDLSELMTLKRYRWNPVFDGKISGMLNGVQTYNDDAIRELLFKQRKIEIDLWEDQFSKYLPADFSNRYNVFSRDRNHIMHNKLIDRTAYMSMKESAEQIEKDLLDALEKLHKIILSEEEKLEIEKQRQIEIQMLEELDHECRENDANVSIKDRYEIEELFHECLSSFITDIEENLRFRDDIEISEDKNYDTGITGSILLIRSNIDELEIELKYKMTIDDSEGADSILCIYNGDGGFETELIYTNGAVEYDDENGLYMPITQDEIGSIDKLVDEVNELIDREMPNYKEIASEDDIADFVFCSECGDDAIYINESILPFGTCMNCGHVNDIHECEKCGSLFNSDEDGMFEDDVAICQSCLDDLEEE